MRTKSLILSTIILAMAAAIQGQDTLFLSVTGPQGSDVRLKDSHGKEYRQEDTLKTAAGSWLLKIVNTGHPAVKVMIRNNSVPVEMREITDFSKSYQVVNNRFLINNNDGFTIGSGFSLQVVSASVIVRQFDLECQTVQPATETRPGQATTFSPPGQHGCGIIYYDVMFLNDPANDPLTKLKILAYHAGTTLGELPAALDSNRFLLPFYILWSSQRTASSQSMGGLVSAALGAVGGLDVTNIADGLSRFIVKRAKTELNIAFFDHFRKILADTSLRDVQTLFPATCMTLGQIGDQIYDYERYLQVLRESFETDLQNLPENLPDIVANHPAFFAKYPWLLASMQSAFYLSDGLMNHVHPGDLIAGFPVGYLGDKSMVNWKGSIQTLQLFSESLRDQEGSGHYWISEHQAMNLVSDRDAMKIYMGLVRQHALRAPYLKIGFAGNTTLVDLLDRIDPAKFDTWYDAYKNFITGFIYKAGRVGNMVSNWKKPSADSIAFLQFYRFCKASIDLVEHCTAVGTLPGLEKLRIKEDLGTWFEVARSAADLALDVSYRNYSCALFKAVYIYDLVMVRIGRRHVPVQDGSIAMTEFGVVGTKNFLTKYGPFIAAMAQAKTSEEVAQAIESAALPPGSARIKRETAFNVALNAYVGPYIGYEQILDYDTSGFLLNTFGVTAPVGISFSRGHSVFFIGTGKAGWSTSLFLSVVDLGAVTSFRFRDDSTAQVPTIHLEDIVSPGLFLSIGIPKWPLSVNLGAQMGPNLRTVNTAANDYSDKVYFRYSASIVVDIPIFSFYTKTKL